MTGRVMYNNIDKITSLTYNTTIHVSANLESGVYLIKLNAGMSEYNSKFIKQ